MKTIKFVAVNSGDGESFCFNVDRKTFIDVTGREPEDLDFQSGNFTYIDDELVFKADDEDKCRLYSNDIFGDSNKEIEVDIKIKTI